MQDLVLTGLRIKQKREEAGLSQTDLAKLLGISHAAVWNYEQGKNSIKQPTAIKLASIFKVTLDWLYGNTDEEQHIVLQNDELPDALLAEGIRRVDLLKEYIDRNGGIHEDVLREILSLVSKSKVLSQKQSG